jgi:hypothetical protein
MGRWQLTLMRDDGACRRHVDRHAFHAAFFVSKHLTAKVISV